MLEETAWLYFVRRRRRETGKRDTAGQCEVGESDAAAALQGGCRYGSRPQTFFLISNIKNHPKASFKTSPMPHIQIELTVESKIER